MDVKKRLDPEFVEIDRCMKIIVARVKQFNPQTQDAVSLKEQVLTMAMQHELSMLMIKSAVMALQLEENMRDKG